jgi:hypothetical protein
MDSRAKTLLQVLQRVRKKLEVKELINFLFFVKRESDWIQYGILIVPEYHGDIIRIWIRPHDSYDIVRAQAIVKIYGDDHFFIEASWLGIVAAYKQVFKLHKICVKVNNMKVFL